MTTIEGSTIGNEPGRTPWIYFGVGKAVLRNVTLSADPSVLSNSACAHEVTMLTSPTRTDKSVPGILLGASARVTVNESSTLDCSVEASGLQNYLIYTASTKFKSAAAANFGLGGRALLQTEVCASRSLCKVQTYIRGELNYTACHDGWTRVLEVGRFCLKDVCMVGEECSSASTEGEWACADGSKRSFDRENMKFCTPAAEKTKLQVVLGACLGCALAFCVLLMAYYIRKRPGRAKKLFKSMLRTECKIVARLLFEVHFWPSHMQM